MSGPHKLDGSARNQGHRRIRPKATALPPGGKAAPSEAGSRDEYLVFGSPVISEEAIAEVVDSLRSGWIGTGPEIQGFEWMLEEYLGVEHMRCVSSCTAALILGMKVLGVGPGDEVLVPAMTFVASANAIEHAGAQPVFVDSDPERTLSLPLSPALSPRTRTTSSRRCGGAPRLTSGASEDLPVQILVVTLRRDLRLKDDASICARPTVGSSLCSDRSILAAAGLAGCLGF